MDSIYTLLVLTIVVLVGAGGVYFMRKYKVEEHEKKIIELTLTLIDLIVQRLDVGFEHKDKLLLATNYVAEAYYLADDLEGKTYAEQKALIKSKTIKICRENDILIDTEILEFIDEAVDLLLEVRSTKKIS